MTPTHKLSVRSMKRLLMVEPELVSVVCKASEITRVPFVVLEGTRSLERQQALYRAGATRTLRSRHLTGHAVDLGPWLNNAIRWDWPLYAVIAEAMKAAAELLETPIEWGGMWQPGPDGPHFQLPWEAFPPAPRELTCSL